MWPKACAGCGEMDPAKLELYDYTSSHAKHIDRRTIAGYHHDTFKVSSLGVFAYLCPSCRAKAKKSYLALTVFWILNLGISGSLTFAMFELFFFPLLWMVISIVGALFWIPFMFRWGRHYIKIKQRGSVFTFAFRSPKFKAIFRETNPGEIVKNWKLYNLFLTSN